MLSRGLATLATLAAGATAGLVHWTPVMDPIPSDSTLAATREAANHADAVLLTVQLPANVPIDAFASAFERCFLFTLEQKLIMAAGQGVRSTLPPRPLPGLAAARYREGQPIGMLWTVARRVSATETPTGNGGRSELLAAWSHRSGATGNTWLAVMPALSPSNSGPTVSRSSGAIEQHGKMLAHAAAPDRVTLALGSSLMLPGGAPVSAVATTLHVLYSRLLLTNATAQLWWDLRYLVRPSSVAQSVVQTKIAQELGGATATTATTSPANAPGVVSSSSPSSSTTM
ncbi:hypothetical protein BC828DRAFT_389414 [Blastocladiella britannica]|nr:hypothetical protein BC828DRAFT_389414 [Blastocladiella britannica]